MLHILFGSQSGNARNLASTVADRLRDEGIEAQVSDMGEVDPEEITGMGQLLIVTSTFGDGEPPDNASEWMSYLKFSDGLDLSHLEYAVLGLGDPYYPHFCQAGKDFDEFLRRHGARALVPRLDCDLYFEEQWPEWAQELIAVLKTPGTG
jgi:sulfite reductase (NADPH) flavoprotein alpha-component